MDSENSGLKVRSLGPVCHPGRASTLPCVDGEARGLAGSAQPGPRLSPPSQLPTSEPHAELSGAAVRRRHWRGWQCGGRGIGGPEPTYCVLSFSVNHSVTTLHTLPPRGLVHLLYLDSMAQFTLFLFESRFSANILTADSRHQIQKASTTGETKNHVSILWNDGEEKSMQISMQMKVTIHNNICPIATF